MTGFKTTGTALALLLAAATSGCATGFGGDEEPGPDLSLYDTWDADRNGMLDENEFAAGSAASLGDIGDFAAWDADRSGALSEDEFYGGAYNVWDVDGDDLLSEAEFGAGTDAWLGDSDMGDFADWDADRSGGLDDSEFYDGWGL
jgi:hypothetical protein